MTTDLESAILAELRSAGVDFFVSVPCKLLAGLIRALEQDASVDHVPVTREEEGLGICAGASLGGRLPAILMQDSGLGNSVNALASLIQYYRLPVVMLISLRGTPGEKIGAQVPMGKLTPPLLDLLRVPTLHGHDCSQVAEMGAMARHAVVAESPVAILLDFHFFGQDT